METSVNYTIYSEKNYELIKKLYNVFWNDRNYYPSISYKDNTRSIEVSYDTAGGIY